MGIRPYKAFTFDGKSSLDYGVYLTGEGVFNAPERAVEMLEIPGRNGNFVLDQGRFQNISVTYKAGIVDYSETDFATRVSNVRNWLCSKVGYCRLEDDYNPNEYRMAAFVSGIEVDHDDLQTGEFEITFDCKPQRWLKSGETAVTVADGGTLDNPTPFEAEPLLAVKGYGDIGFNNFNLTIENAILGEVILKQGTKGYYLETLSGIDFSIMNNGDTITLSEIQDVYRYEKSSAPYYSPTSVSVADSNTLFHSVATALGNVGASIITSVDDLTFSVGTTSSYTNTTTLTVVMNGVTYTWERALTIQYNSSQNIITFVSNYSQTPSGSGFPRATGNSYNGVLYGMSTKSLLGDPTYIDCDIGEAYFISSGGEIVTLNQHIDLGSDLPKLASGSNTVTYDNTITDLKVTPRWWKV